MKSLSKHLSRLRLVTVVAAAGIAVSAGARAADITYTLEGVTFNDGGKAHGTLTVDSTGMLLSANFFTTGGTVLHHGYTYDYPAQSDLTQPDPFDSRLDPTLSFELQEGDVTNGSYILLDFANSLTLGGTDPILTGGASSECDNCNHTRFIIAGDVTTDPPVVTPEPLSLTLLGTGLLGLALVRRRH